MYYIGIDIGGMSLKGGIVSEDGRVLKKDTVKTVVGDSQALIKNAEELCLKLLYNVPVDVEAIGLGIPGTINEKNGVIVYSNNIKIEDVHICEELNKRLGFPVWADNDANCAALGETLFGGAKGKKNVIFITLGTGVGTGIIVDGKVMAGFGGAGAEGGHMVIKSGGIPCNCGRRGCWEAYASATGLIRETKKCIDKYPDSELARIAEGDGRVSGRTAFRAAEAGDKVGRRVVNTYIKHVSEGVVNLINIFRPDVFVIGGGISNEGGDFIKRINNYAAKHAFGGKRNVPVEVVKAELLNDAGILGAAAICMMKRDTDWVRC
ncbi:MAG: ROK family protein [Christensenellaceae bacterium]|jgi:glucokinase|nr:ROK family protein [Christensenellaceae bacterium]